MKVLRRFFDFYLDASIHIAFGVFALVHVTGLILNIPVDAHLSWFLFFGSISCYNFVKYGVEGEKYIVTGGRHLKKIRSASVIAFGFAVYHAYFFRNEVWVGLFCLLVLTALYALPVLPHAKNLRSWGGIKIFVVALVWAGATVLLPVISAQSPISWDIGIETLQRFLFILIAMVPFEIRDLAYDSPLLKTIPQRFGVKRTKIFGGFLTLLFFLLIFWKDDFTKMEVIGKGILSVILGCILWMTKRKQQVYFASFWVEASPLVWWGIMLWLQNRTYFCIQIHP